MGQMFPPGPLAEPDESAVVEPGGGAMDVDPGGGGLLEEACGLTADGVRAVQVQPGLLPILHLKHDSVARWGPVN